MAIKIQGVDVIDDSRNAVNLSDVTASGNINFTGTGSIQVPAGTTAERPGSPAAGEIRYNTDEESLEQYNGELWTAVGGGFERVHVTSSHNSFNNEYIYADTESGSLNITLPASPNEYDTVIISDEAGNFAFNNVTVSRNGSTIAGKSENFILGLSFREYTFVYYDNTWNVFVKEIRKDTGAGFGITGPTSGNEGDEITLFIDGYDTGASYNIQVSDGTFTRTSESIYWTLPSVSQDQSHFIQVEESSTSGTEIVTYEVQVFNIPTIPDDAVSVSGPSGTLFFESNTYEQQTADNDWIEFQGELTVDPSSIGSLTYDSANSTTSELRFTGFENYESKILLTEAYESFTVGSIVTDSRGISSASYDNVSFDVSSEDTFPASIAFSPDGTKMFVVGGSSDTIYSYTLSTGFDLSTASYDNVSFDPNSEELLPRGIAFNTDGTRMFVVGSSSESVHSYTLSTPFGISTASYDVSFDISSEESGLLDIAFSPDGTRMFVNSAVVRSYTLSTPFDLSSASYDNVSFDVSSEDSSSRGIIFSPDGTKMFVAGASSESVHSYTLSTPFDLSSASYDNVSFDVFPEIRSPYGIAFSPDGTKLLIADRSSESVHSCTTNSFATYVNPLSSAPIEVYDPDLINHGIVLSNSSETAFVSDKAFNVLSYSINTNTVDVTLGYDNDSDAVVGINDSVLLQGMLDISRVSSDNVFTNITSELTNPNSIALSPDGTNIFVTDYDGGLGEPLRPASVYRISLGEAFDITTKVFDQSFDVSSEESRPIDVAFSPDGTKMFVVGIGDSSDSVYSYTLSTGFDLSSASYDGVSFDVSSEDTSPRDVEFNTDGTKMFVFGTDTDSIHSYTLSTGFDLSTASYDNESFDVSSEDTDPEGIAFNTDGTKMFVVGGFSDTIYSYTLSTPFDLSSVSYDNVSFGPIYSMSASGPTLVPFSDVAFNPDGTKLFIPRREGEGGVSSHTLRNNGVGLFTVNDIVVSNSETTLTLLGTPSIAPGACSLPDWSTQVEFTSFNESNGNLVMTSDRYFTDNGKRFLKFKIEGDDIDNDILNARVNLWKGA